MKTSQIHHGLRALVVFGILLAGLTKIYSQGFVNLNFENVNTSQGSTLPTNAVFGWLVSSPFIFYNDIALDGNVVDLVGTNNSVGPSAIQGNYSIFIQGGSQFDPDHSGAAIMQTVLVPATSHSITYWGGQLQVSFNNQALAFNAIGSGSGYTIWQADVSAFAGQTGQFSFVAPWQTSGLLDNIQFSTSPVPEPSTFALAALGGLLLGFRRWRR